MKGKKGGQLIAAIGLLQRLNVDFRTHIRELRRIYDTGHFRDSKFMTPWASRMHAEGQGCDED